MKYSKKHIAAVQARLREYERVLALPRFERLPWCNICNTLKDDSCEDEGCLDCLLGYCAFKGDFGANRNTKTEQRAQFAHLKKMLAKNGYVFE